MWVPAAAWTGTITVLHLDIRFEAKASDYVICANVQNFCNCSKGKLQYVDHWRRIQFIERNLNDRHALDACITNLVIHLILDILRYHIQYGACKQ